MWQVHHDARQFFLACERWEDGEQLPHSTLGNTVRQLVDDCAIQVTITCPEAMFLGVMENALATMKAAAGA